MLFEFQIKHFKQSLLSLNQRSNLDKQRDAVIGIKIKDFHEIAGLKFTYSRKIRNIIIKQTG